MALPVVNEQFTSIWSSHVIVLSGGIGLTHTQRYNAHYRTTGEVHLHQGRYKSFPIQDDEHFVSLL